MQVGKKFCKIFILNSVHRLGQFNFNDNYTIAKEENSINNISLLFRKCLPRCNRSMLVSVH